MNEKFDFVISDEIGSGHTAKVVKCTRKEDDSKKTYALKIIEHTKKCPKELVENEFSIQSKMDHPNIAKVIEANSDEKHTYILQEYLEGGDLFDYVEANGPLKESKVKTIMRKLLSAVQYMHNNNVVHRDLKPENIMLEKKGDPTSINIIDFGFATNLEKGQYETKVLGTYEYFSPELCKKMPYNHKNDIWAVGIIAYILLAGAYPFNGKTVQQLKNSITKGEIKWSPRISQNAKNFI